MPARVRGRASPQRRAAPAAARRAAQTAARPSALGAGRRAAGARTQAGHPAQPRQRAGAPAPGRDAAPDRSRPRRRSPGQAGGGGSGWSPATPVPGAGAWTRGALAALARRSRQSRSGNAACRRSACSNRAARTPRSQVAAWVLEAFEAGPASLAGATSGNCCSVSSLTGQRAVPQLSSPWSSRAWAGACEPMPSRRQAARLSRTRNTVVCVGGWLSTRTAQMRCLRGAGVAPSPSRPRSTGTSSAATRSVSTSLAASAVAGREHGKAGHQRGQRGSLSKFMVDLHKSSAQDGRNRDGFGRAVARVGRFLRDGRRFGSDRAAGRLVIGP